MVKITKKFAPADEDTLQVTEETVVDAKVDNFILDQFTMGATSVVLNFDWPDRGLIGSTTYERVG